MPDYTIRVYQINYYIKLHLPDLFYYFKNNDLSFDLIYQKWIMTLFSNYLPIKKLVILWHFFLIDNWEALIKFSFILIKLCKERLMKIDLESLCKFTKDIEWLENISELELFNMYLNINTDMKYTNIITNESLEDLKDQFYMDLVKNKLENTTLLKDKWQEDQKEAINRYYTKYNKVSNIVKDQVKLFKKKIETVTKKYQTALVDYQSSLSRFNNNKKSLTDLVDEREGLEFVVSNMDTHNKTKLTTEKIDSLKTGKVNEDFSNSLPKRQSRINSLFNNLLSYTGLKNPKKNSVNQNEVLFLQEKEKLSRKSHDIISQIDSLNQKIRLEVRLVILAYLNYFFKIKYFSF